MKKVSKVCKDVGEMLEFIESTLENSELTKRDFHQALLVSEEIVAKFQKLADIETYTVTVSESFGEHSIIFSFSGSQPFELDDENEDDFGGKILRYYGEKIKYRYRSGVNTVTFVASQSFTRYLRFSTIAFVVSLFFCGILYLTTPQETRQFILAEFISPIEGIFAKAVCMLATPVTFFCIVSNIADYSNLIDRYPDVRRLIIRYIGTSVVAIGIGYGLYLGIRPLVMDFGTMEEFHISDSTTLNFSTIWNALEFMVPDSILSPFIVSETLPMLFLAAISGISVGIIDRQSEKCRELVDMLRSFFCKMLYIVFDFGAVMKKWGFPKNRWKYPFLWEPT